MKKVIEKIRQKPEHKQNQIIWAIAGVVVVALFIIWIVIGNTKRENSPDSIFNNFNQEFNSNKQLFPNLFNKDK